MLQPIAREERRGDAAESPTVAPRCAAPRSSGSSSRHRCCVRPLSCHAQLLLTGSRPDMRVQTTPLPKLTPSSPTDPSRCAAQDTHGTNGKEEEPDAAARLSERVPMPARARALSLLLSRLAQAREAGSRCASKSAQGAGAGLRAASAPRCWAVGVRTCAMRVGIRPPAAGGSAVV